MREQKTVAVGRASWLWLLALVVPAVGNAAPPLSGAIFTTTEDGTVVNENVHYDTKPEVYLDGGPGPNAPARAAGLPEGDYFFQVTDPSGKDLLSSDNVSCRMVHVSADGVITQRLSSYLTDAGDTITATNYAWSNKDKKWIAVDCFDPDGNGVDDYHRTGQDADHWADKGAITVQLFPFDDTPNNGGVYKAWMTPIEDYLENIGGFDALADCAGLTTKAACNLNNEAYSAGNFHGFIGSDSKTDNFKVKLKGRVCDSPLISVTKFHDADADGYWDLGEAEVTGWYVGYTTPIGESLSLYTPYDALAPVSGTYSFTEDVPAGVAQTMAELDGTLQSSYPSADPTVDVSVAGTCGETHDLVYGNVGLGSVTACKVYDRDGSGTADAGEPYVAGWKMTLTGTDVLGNSVSRVGTTGNSGCVTFGDLLPGNYTVTEGTPLDAGWVATGGTSSAVVITSSVSGSVISGTAASRSFTNRYVASPVDFGTKGYWHNKNGLTELDGDADDDANGVPDIVDHANGLDPYDDATAYFGAGDEPFDGFFDNGDPVDAAFNDGGVEIWAGGTWASEVSQFLVDSNADADLNGHREQLAQQLLAFIFNMHFRAGCLDSMVEYADGTWYDGGGLIADAIAAWQTGTDQERTDMEQLLDGFNNMDSVAYVPCDPPAPQF